MFSVMLNSSYKTNSKYKKFTFIPFASLYLIIFYSKNDKNNI